MGCCISKGAATEEDNEVPPVFPDKSVTNPEVGALEESVKAESTVPALANICPYAAKAKCNSTNERSPVHSARRCPVVMVDEGEDEGDNVGETKIEIEPEEMDENFLITDEDDVFSEINMARAIVKKCNAAMLSTDELIAALIGTEDNATTRDESVTEVV